MNNLYKQFHKFVNDQPEDRIIHHWKGWCECAIGDFYYERQSEIKESSYPQGIVARIRWEGEPHMIAIMDILDFHGYTGDNEEAKKFIQENFDTNYIETYGQLKEVMDFLDPNTCS